MYADDLKFFRPVTSSTDAAVMESSLEHVEWCQRNMMDLNITNCEVITFSRRAEPNRYIHDYNVNQQPLRQVTAVKDLGVLLDEKMTFEVH